MNEIPNTKLLEDCFTLNVEETKNKYACGFESHLENFIAYTSCGVRFIHGKSGIDTSMIVRNLAKALCEKRLIKGAHIVDDYTGIEKYKSFMKWLLVEEFKVNKNNSNKYLTDMLPEAKDQKDAPYLLILDRFDDVFNHPNIPTAIKVLAQKCNLNNKLSVIAIINNKDIPVNATKLWNANHKISKISLEFSIKKETF